MSRWVKQSGSFVRLDDVATGRLTSPVRASATATMLGPRAADAHASAHTKGAWGELVASTPAAADVVRLVVWSGGSSGAVNSILFDLGIGAAGSETVLVANIASMSYNSSFGANVIEIPVRIASGSRLSMRWQSGRASAGGLWVGVWLGVYADGGQSASSVDTIGANTAATTGVALGSTNNTFVQVTAATAQRYRAIVVCPTSNDSTMAASQATFDLGVGPSGSEKVYETGVVYENNTSERPGMWAGGSTCVHVDVPAGTRLAVRPIDSAIASNAGYSVVLLGIPY